MRSVLLAAVAVLASMPASAAVYELVNPVRDAFTIESQARAPTFRLEISNAAVQRGSFNFSVLGGSGFTAAQGTVPTGDVADFISLTGVDDTINPTSSALHGPLTARATFAADGSILSSNFFSLGVNSDFNFGGSSASFGGTYGGDAFRCGGRGTECRAFGTLALSGFTPATAVPEPVSMAAFGAGLLGLAFARRRQAA